MPAACSWGRWGEGEREWGRVSRCSPCGQHPPHPQPPPPPAPAPQLGTLHTHDTHIWAPHLDTQPTTLTPGEENFTVLNKRQDSKCTENCSKDAPVCLRPKEPEGQPVLDLKKTPAANLCASEVKAGTERHCSRSADPSPAVNTATIL